MKFGENGEGGFKILEIGSGRGGQNSAKNSGGATPLPFSEISMPMSVTVFFVKPRGVSAWFHFLELATGGGRFFSANGASHVAKGVDIFIYFGVVL